MTVEQITQGEAAFLLVTCVELRGGVFALDEENYFHLNLDGIDFAKWNTTPDFVAAAVMSLRDEVRQILLSRRVMH